MLVQAPAMIKIKSGHISLWHCHGKRYQFKVKTLRRSTAATEADLRKARDQGARRN
jgi:hypothetical protein